MDTKAVDAFMAGCLADVEGPDFDNTTTCLAYDGITRPEFLKLAALIGHDYAKDVVALKLGYSDGARLAVANFVVPYGYEITEVERDDPL